MLRDALTILMKNIQLFDSGWQSDEYLLKRRTFELVYNQVKMK